MSDQIDETSGKENIAGKIADDEDSKLVSLAQSGDTAAFGELIEKHQRAVYGIVSRMVNDRDEADDIVQDVFVSVWKSIGGFRQTAKFSTWLHTITVNTALRRVKMMKTRSGLSFDDPDTGLADVIAADESTSPAAGFEKKERDASVRKAIESLPDKHRMTVILHYFEHRTCDEIASIMECSTGTVWSRLHYACKQLKHELKWLIQEN